jgi:endonuclease I/PKD repeat protein
VEIIHFKHKREATMNKVITNKFYPVTFLFLVLIFNLNLVFAQPDPGYYSSVDESSPSALKASLHNIIKDHTKIPYTSSATDTWDVLELAGEDVDNSNNVIALYKNSTYSKVGGGNNDYNREHSWPKSFGFPDDGSSNYPYTDMHHLFIANSSYNSSRSNKPFDICTSGCTEKTTDVNNGRGGAGQSNFTKTDVWDVWQARQGDIARAMFYMAVRYEGGTHGITNFAEPDLELTDNLTLIENSATGNNESQAYMGLLSVLITWHYNDPVDIYEHQHNESVENGQGNRNPFIDNPEWAKCVFELVCDGGGSDTTAPSAPSNLSATAETNVIAVDWFNNDEADLAGYNLYRSTTSGTGFSKLNSTLISASNYSDLSVIANTTYYYRVTAVDNSSNESTNSAQASATATGNPPTGNILQNGVAKTGLSGAKDNQQTLTMVVPAGASNLSFDMSGGSGDADLYVNFGSAATTSNYDCRPYIGGNVESCPITSAQTGTYFVMINAYSTYSGVSLTGSYTSESSNSAPNASFTSNCSDLNCSFNASASSDSDGSVTSYSWSFGGSGGVSVSNTFASAGSYSVTLTVTDNDGATDTATQTVTVTEAPPPTGNVLSNGVAVSGLSASTNGTLLYTMQIPAGASDLNFAISGGNGDADLYVRFGSVPTTSNYDCRPYIGGNVESCPIALAQTGTYHVMVRAYQAFSDVSLVGSFSSSGGSQQSLFSNSNNVSIPDNNPIGGTSNIAVNRSGNAGNLEITYDIVHTYRGDLTVILVDPNGNESTLRSPSGGGTNNLNETININKGTTAANGIWGLKVIDGAGADVGNIDFWSVEFL